MIEKEHKERKALLEKEANASMMAIEAPPIQPTSSTTAQITVSVSNNSVDNPTKNFEPSEGALVPVNIQQQPEPMDINKAQFDLMSMLRSDLDDDQFDNERYYRYCERCLHGDCCHVTKRVTITSALCPIP